MTRFFRSAVTLTAFMLLCGLAGWFSSALRPLFLQRMELIAFDHYQAAVRPPPIGEKISIVLATEASMREFRQWPWPRTVHAGLMGKLGLAKHVVLDILFPEESNPDDDLMLAAMARELGNVTVAVHLSPDGSEGKPTLFLPYRELAEAVSGFGVTNLRPEPDGIYRDAPLFQIHDQELIPSLSLATWMALRNTSPAIEADEKGYRVTMPAGAFAVDSNLDFKIHHPQSEVPIYEYADVYHGRVPPETFRDHVVFVGVNSAGASDFFPIGRGRILPGAVFNAHALATLLHGWIPGAGPDWAANLACLVLAGIGAFLGLREGLKIGLVFFLITVLLWLFLHGGLFYWLRLWLPPIRPVLVGLLAFLLATGVQLRYFSKEWRTQTLSVDSLLVLSRREFDPEQMTFPAYLRENWREVEKWSGMRLVAAGAGAEDPEVAACLSILAEGGAGAGAGKEEEQATVIAGDDGTSRLLLCLPQWDDAEKHYCVLEWRGNKSGEIQKSIAALVITAAINFRAAAESQARKELFLGVIKLIMGAIDAKDPTTAGHSERVAGLAKELAEKMGLSPPQAEEVYLSGLLHDVGKIGIPDSVLGKPGRLTDEEMDVMRRHPIIGSELLGKIKISNLILRGVVEHHERLDGRGYPHGIAEAAMSQVGKILKVADVYDALASKRQYKEPMEPKLVYKILTEGVDKEFDREILTLFIKDRFADMPPLTPAAGAEPTS